MLPSFGQGRLLRLKSLNFLTQLHDQLIVMAITVLKLLAKSLQVLDMAFHRRFLKIKSRPGRAN
jgi:isopenicillin N synthase-like dioxygenase